MLGVPIPYAILLAFAGLICYGIGLAAYRLILHPLARFPGPKLAAATYWTSFYIDILKAPYAGTELTWINNLHAQYGPIVRISPDELHVNDPEWFDTLYNKGRREKWLRNHKANGSPGSIASTESRELHRARRTPIQAFFSKQAISQLEGSIHAKVKQMCDRIQAEFAATQQILPIGTAFTALTLDVITEYCFGKCWNTLSEPGFSPEWKETFTNLFLPIPLVKQLPIILHAVNLIPLNVIAKADANLARTAIAKERSLGIVKALIAEHNETCTQDQKGMETASRDNIFSTILKSDIPASEKTAERINDEGFVMIVAGAETTAKALTSAVYRLHSHPAWLAKVRSEVDKVMPGTGLPSSSTIERDCPALIACVKETLRLSDSVTNRLQLYDAYTPLTYGDWIIPCGTPISMSYSQIHQNPAIFENPYEFKPMRWLGPDAERLGRYYVPFAKGSRSCLGINLAYCEIHLALVAILKRFDIQLYDVDKVRDIDVVRDCFVGFPSPEARPLRVKVTERKLA